MIVGSRVFRRLRIALLAVGVWLVGVFAVLYAADAVFGPTAGLDWLHEVLLWPLGLVARFYEWVSGRRPALHGGEITVHGNVRRLYMAVTAITYLSLLTAMAYAILTWIDRHRPRETRDR